MEILRKDSWNQQYAEEKVKKTLLDLLFYLIFLLVVSIISLDTIGQTTYYMADMLNKILVIHPFDLNARDATTNKSDESTFLELTTVPEYWSYLHIQFLSTIYADVLPNSTHSLFVQTENMLLGPPRLRQLRVRNGTCAIHQLFRMRFRDCYASFSGSNEARQPFGPATGTAWRYSTADELGGGTFYWGQLGAYPSGGYYRDLSLDRTATERMVQQLEDDNWIDAASRLVLVEFTLYNANLNLFCVAKLLAELPATGGLLTSASFPTLKLLRFVTPFDYAVLACECLFLLQTIWFTSVELQQLRSERGAYFRSFWNLVDMSIVAIAYTSLAFSAYRYVYLSGLDLKVRSAEHHLNLDTLAFWQVQYNTAMACCVFLVWLKVFKYLSFNRTLLQLSLTLSRCATDLLAFGLMFTIVFVAYAQLGYVLFGTENRDFRTYADSLLTLLRTVLGDFDYPAIERANRVLGPIYFVSYIFFVFFVLLNMFLAIINDTYAEVKAEPSGADALRVAPYLRRQLGALFGWLGAGCCWVKRFASGQRAADDALKEPAVKRSTEEVAKTSAERVTQQSSLPPAADCVPIEGVCLRDIFERVSDAGALQQAQANWQRRLEVVERTLDIVVDKLNEFLVQNREHEHNRRLAAAAAADGANESRL